MGLDVKVLDKNQDEIDLKQTFDDDEEVGMVNADDFEYVADQDELDASFIPENPDDDDALYGSGYDDEDDFGDDDDDEDDFPGSMVMDSMSDDDE